MESGLHPLLPIIIFPKLLISPVQLPTGLQLDLLFNLSSTSLQPILLDPPPLLRTSSPPQTDCTDHSTGLRPQPFLLDATNLCSQKKKPIASALLDRSPPHLTASPTPRPITAPSTFNFTFTAQPLRSPLSRPQPLPNRRPPPPAFNHSSPISSAHHSQQTAPPSVPSSSSRNSSSPLFSSPPVFNRTSSTSSSTPTSSPRLTAATPTSSPHRTVTSNLFLSFNPQHTPQPPASTSSPLHRLPLRCTNLASSPPLLHLSTSDCTPGPASPPH